MNVREDKMTNYRGLQTRKPSLTCCVPELFRVSRRVKQENILLDVVKQVAQLYNYKHHNQNSKREFPLLISSTQNKRLTIHYRTWLILYRYISRIFFFFFFFFLTIFCEYCFLSIIYVSVNFIKCFPLIMKQKNKIKFIKR